MHKKFFQVKCGNIIKYRSNARNKNIYKCRMQRNMNINIDQMNIDRILEKTTYNTIENAGAMTKSRRESGFLEK